MTLPIYVYGSEVLREVAEEVDVDKTDKEELRRYIDDMFETMYHADGVGLAAPQVGDSRRILVVDGRDVYSLQRGAPQEDDRALSGRGLKGGGGDSGRFRLPYGAA